MHRLFSFFFALLLTSQALFGQLAPAPRPCGENGDRVALPLCGGADPWFYRHDGRYYHCYSVGNGVAVRAADRLSELTTAEGTVVYTAPAGTDRSCNYWAPELHFINGRWYIYVAADDGRNENHRMYVLSGDDPTGPFTMEGRIADPADKWAIDGTVLQKDGQLWFLWSGWEGDSDGQQNLYIAPMDSPTHISGDRVLLSAPDLKWERQGMAINEGPEILQKDGAVYVVYSASGSWTDDYCLGMLRLTGCDPLRADHWAKSLLPVFKKARTAYGPGHCSFVSSADGETDYIVYHANEESGTGWNGRSIRIQPFRWLGKTPVFGRPLPAGSTVALS